jgi:predicted nucleotidyltransferase/biotin operon repressor
VAGLDGDVLVLLAGTTQAMSGREIAERLGLRSHDGVRKSLQRLTGQGIVVREGSRHAFLHQLNREHLGAAAVLALAGMRTELWARIREATAQWQTPPVHLSAFGSAARGDGDDESDLDLLVVRPTDIPEEDSVWLEQVDGLRERVERWTGNRVSIIEQGEEELTGQLAHSQPPQVLHAVLREGIDLAGVPVRRLLGELRAS